MIDTEIEINVHVECGGIVPPEGVTMVPENGVEPDTTPDATAAPIPRRAAPRILHAVAVYLVEPHDGEPTEYYASGDPVIVDTIGCGTLLNDFMDQIEWDEDWISPHVAILKATPAFMENRARIIAARERIGSER